MVRCRWRSSAAWQDSQRRIQSLDPGRVRFCHHTDVIHR